MIDINEILSILPHRYPFLLVDRIVEFEPNKMAKGIKNITVNEPFFQGHFPGHPVMPGVLIVEAMAQVGGILALKSAEVTDSLVYFMGIEKAKFRQPVMPGDRLELVLDVMQTRGKVWRFNGMAYVNEKRVAEAGLMATMMEGE